MILDNELMKNAIIRINELQQEVVTQVSKIEGTEEYVKKQVELFKQEEALHRQCKAYLK